MMSEYDHQFLRQRQLRASAQLDQLLVRGQALDARIRRVSKRIAEFNHESEPWYWRWFKMFDD